MLAIGKDWRACVSICFATALNVQCGRRSVSQCGTFGAGGVLEDFEPGGRSGSERARQRLEG